MKIKKKSSKRKTLSRPKKTATSAKKKKPGRQSGRQTDQPADLQFRERRLKDIPFVERHPTAEARKYQDTLPLPFGGEVKKDAMRDHGLIH